VTRFVGPEAKMRLDKVHTQHSVFRNNDSALHSTLYSLPTVMRWRNVANRTRWNGRCTVIHCDLWLLTNVKYHCHQITKSVNQTNGGGLDRATEYSTSTVVFSRERDRRRPFSQVRFAVMDLILMNAERALFTWSCQAALLD